MDTPRAEKLRLIATAQALSMTAKSMNEYVRYFVEENGLRADIEPLSTAEQFQIAQEATRKILEYEA